VVPTTQVALNVLRQFKIVAGPGGLTISGTDLELSAVGTTTLVDVDRPGTFYVTARTLMAALDKLTGETISVDVGGGRARVSSGTGNVDLALYANDDFPVFPDLSDVSMSAIDREKFLAGVDSVYRAASQEVTRANLMMVSVADGRMTACDNARLHQFVLGDDFPVSLQIPIKALDSKRLPALLRDDSLKTVQVGETKNHLVFRLGTFIFLASKVTAKYPDVESLLLVPARTENHHQMTVDRDDLARAISLVTVTADTDTSAIKLDISGTTLTLRSKNKEGERAEYSVTVGWTGSPRSLVVNYGFLSDMVASSEAKVLKFLIGDDTKTAKRPLLLEDSKAGFTGLIQQMRVEV
jgi:DNA polymerase III sliding clamp (beta) subunit (PCNA family)